MKYETIIGIDPGKTGGIIILNKKNIQMFFIPKIRNEVDIKKLNNIFKECNSEKSIVVMESVHAIFGSSAKSTFSFGEINGILKTVIISNGFPLQMVQPKKWQAEMFEGIPIITKLSSTGKTKIKQTKKMAEIVVCRLFPKLDLYITEKGNPSKNIHSGLMDALLIAEYGRRKLL